MLIKTKKKQPFHVQVDESYFEVETLTATEDAEIRKNHTEYKGQLPQLDEASYTDEKFRKMVKGWESVYDLEGNEVAYSDKVKNEFAELNPDMARYIIRKADNHDAAKREADKENLGKSQSGKKKE